MHDKDSIYMYELFWGTYKVETQKREMGNGEMRK